jgi:hypothetical protein
MKRARVAGGITLLRILCLLAGCAAGPNLLRDSARPDGGSSAGFWLGLWHGLIRERREPRDDGQAGRVGSGHNFSRTTLAYIYPIVNTYTGY